jgi:hypothetical protein
MPYRVRTDEQYESIEKPVQVGIPRRAQVHCVHDCIAQKEYIWPEKKKKKLYVPTPAIYIFIRVHVHYMYLPVTPWSLLRLITP